MKLRSLLRNFVFSFITCTAGLGLLATSGNAQKTQLEKAQNKNTITQSTKQRSSYDSGTQANDLVALMDALGHKRFAVVGFDTGMPIAYVLAADHPHRVERLAVGEAIPGALPRCADSW